MKYEIRSIGLWSFIKQSFFLNLVLGFLVGIIYAFCLGMFLNISSRFPLLGTNAPDIDNASLGAMVLFLPIICACSMTVFNTIIGVILVLLYNFLSRIVGGLQFELEPAPATFERPVVAPPVMASTMRPGAPSPPPYYHAPQTPTAPSDAPKGPTEPPPASKYE